jgi:N-acetylglucosamine kinase-like BadF-type ATPase
MTTRYFAGIDAGQTSTTAIVGDERGRILARGTAGPADEVGADGTSTRLRDALRGALEDAARSAGLARDVRFESIVAGVSGYEGTIYGVRPDLPTDRFVLTHDAPIAHAGALAGGPGIVAVAGTGSVVYGVDKRGNSATIGGWGYLFGDEGSAFGIAVDALRTAAIAEDAGDLREPLLRRARAQFGATSLRTIVRSFYAGRIERNAIAAFVQAVVSEAESGDKIAAEIVAAGASRLVGQVRLCAKRLRMRKPKVTAVGGMLRSAWYARVLERAFAKLTPSFVYVQPLHEPVTGALLVAYREAGIDPPKLIERREMLVSSE